MNIIARYKPVLFISPLLLILSFGIFMEAYPNRRQINNHRHNLCIFISEKGLGDLLLQCGIKMDLLKFQSLRIIISICLSLPFLLLDKSVKGLLMICCLSVVIYKYFYLYLYDKDRRRIKELNKELPYGIKTVVYLNYIYPVINALEKAINYVPPAFENDFRTLIKDIDEDPNSYRPYQDFVNRYNGKLNQLDFYLRILYRMSISGKDEEKLLSNMNYSISGEINRVRQMKNDSINSTIQYLGMLPVVLVTAMLTYVLVIVSGTI